MCTRDYVPLFAVFPLGVYALISLLELAIFGRNRGNPQLQRQQQQQPRRNVLQISRSIYEQLDGEILQLLLSNRDFDSNGMLALNAATGMAK